MCGISGIASGAGVVDMAEVKAMNNILAHRGPDGEGTWSSETREVVFGHRRLSIIDLSETAGQPMHYLSRYTITFNGEIYNYKELRKKLEAKGFTFRTQSDTEVLLAAYACWQENCLAELNGMFAFAIYDSATDELFCARDRFGEKPFYYSDKNGVFVFASEIKAIRNSRNEHSIDPYMAYLFLNYELEEDPEKEERTFFTHVTRLKKAHFLKFKRGNIPVQKKYWSVEAKGPTQKISFEQAAEKFRELFSDSIRLRLRADVPVGSSLSGGLDSSSVVLAINEQLHGKDTQTTFSARFPGTELDEGYYMDLVTKNKNIRQFTVNPDLTTLLAELEKIVYYQDEPFRTASIFAQWEVYKLASSKNTKVLLDGQGADEYLAGYTHFAVAYAREFKNSPARMKAELEKYRRNNQDFLFKPGIGFMAESLFPLATQALRKMKNEIKGVPRNELVSDSLYGEFKRKTPPFPYFGSLQAALHYSTFNYGLERLLRFADRSSMASSIEVRLPFLDHRLVEFVFSLPSTYKIRDGWSKALLRQSMRDLLPAEICYRKNKLGFQAPQQEWERTTAWKQWAQQPHQAAVDAGWVDIKAPLSWRSVNLGILSQINKMEAR